MTTSGYKVYKDRSAPAVDAQWLNEVSTVVYSLLGSGAPQYLPPTSRAELLAYLGIAANTMNVQITTTVATAGQTAFTAPIYVPGINNLSVYVDGIRKNLQSGDYTETSSTVFTLTVPATAGAKVVAVVLAANAIGTASAANITYQNSNVKDALDAINLSDYAALQAYTGSARSVYITGYLTSAAPSGIAGPFTRDDSDTTTASNGGTVIVDALGRRWKRQYSGPVNVQWFGAIGDGSADDSLGMARALATGKCIDLAWKTYRITSKVTVSVANTVVKNGTLLFDGANTTRLMDIAADDVRFFNVILDGGDKQPSGALVYLKPNIKRPRFHNCTVQNITGRAKGTNALNQMYGFLISPYGVVDFGFFGCVFRNIKKYNDGVVGGPATIGGGFCGSMFIGMDEDLLPPTAPQSVITSGKIADCVAEDIQTIRAVGLSRADQINFDDADAIRFYGDPSGASELDVEITNFTCQKVSKRGVKVSVVKGVTIDGLIVDGRGLPYAPVCIAKLESGTTARKLIGIAGSAVNAFYQGAELNGGKDVLLDGMDIDFCYSGWQHDCVNDTVISNVTVKNLNLRAVQSEGFRRYYHAEITTASGLSLEDSKIVCTGNNAVGILSEAALDGSGGLKVRNVEIVNGEVNIQGFGADVEDLRVRITSSAYAGYAPGNALVRIGPGVGTAGCTVNRLDVDASGINTGYLSATRQWLVLLYSDKMKASNLYLKVPEGLVTTYPHFDIVGNDLTIDGLNYDGPGRSNIATVVASSRWSIKNAVRVGTGACTEPFLYTNNAGSGNGVFENVTDFRPTNQPTITILNGLGTGNGYIVSNVSSKTSNTNVVQHGGLATVTNANKFP